MYVGTLVIDRKGRVIKSTVNWDVLREAFIEIMAQKLAERMRRDIDAGVFDTVAAGRTDEHHRPGDDEERGAVLVCDGALGHGPH